MLENILGTGSTPKMGLRSSDELLILAFSSDDILIEW
jgi:hypothetical protein